MNDAYYTLSDATRRREYDAQRRRYGFSGGRSNAGAGTYADPFDDDFDEEIPAGGSGAANGGGFPFSWAWSFFSGQQDPRSTQQERQQTENDQFGDVFEEMLREEGMAEQNGNNSTSKFWSMAGGVSGGVMGFIVGNFPGMMAGAVAGNRLGAVRDAKGKSVYEVFKDLPQSERAQLLSQLAAKVLAHAVGAS